MMPSCADKSVDRTRPHDSPFASSYDQIRDLRPVSCKWIASKQCPSGPPAHGSPAEQGRYPGNWIAPKQSVRFSHTVSLRRTRSIIREVDRLKAVLPVLAHGSSRRTRPISGGSGLPQSSPSGFSATVLPRDKGNILLVDLPKSTPFGSPHSSPVGQGPNIPGSGSPQSSPSGPPHGVSRGTRAISYKVDRLKNSPSSACTRFSRRTSANSSTEVDRLKAVLSRFSAGVLPRGQGHL